MGQVLHKQDLHSIWWLARKQINKFILFCSLKMIFLLTKFYIFYFLLNFKSNNIIWNLKNFIIISFCNSNIF